jgi:hypothetical protein
MAAASQQEAKVGSGIQVDYSFVGEATREASSHRAIDCL